MSTTTTAEVALIILNAKDGKLSVRFAITRTDDAADELSEPRVKEQQLDFDVADLSTLNVTVGAATLAGDDAARACKRAAYKALRRAFNGKTGAIAAAITNLDPNG